MCVRVCRERGRERERESVCKRERVCVCVRERERERERASVCACVRVHVHVCMCVKEVSPKSSLKLILLQNVPMPKSVGLATAWSNSHSGASLAGKSSLPLPPAVPRLPHVAPCPPSCCPCACLSLPCPALILGFVRAVVWMVSNIRGFFFPFQFCAWPHYHHGWHFKNKNRMY